MHEVVKVIAVDDFFIVAEFENGEERIYDIKPLIKRGGVWKSLGNKNIFDRVYIEYGAVTWLNGDGIEVDICPDTLYADSEPYIAKGENPIKRRVI